jgi:hypothetical protein
MISRDLLGSITISSRCGDQYLDMGMVDGATEQGQSWRVLWRAQPYDNGLPVSLCEHGVAATPAASSFSPSFPHGSGKLHRFGSRPAGVDVTEWLSRVKLTRTARFWWCT